MRGRCKVLLSSTGHAQVKAEPYCLSQSCRGGWPEAGGQLAGEEAAAREADILIETELWKQVAVNQEGINDCIQVFVLVHSLCGAKSLKRSFLGGRAMPCMSCSVSRVHSLKLFALGSWPCLLCLAHCH